MDDSGATNEAGRWLSYAELAELRGITRKAAIRLTQRHQWRRQPGNDGATRVFVPADIASRQTPRDGGTLTPPPPLPPQAAFETALAAIEAAHASEVAALRERADTSEQGRLAAQALADAALGNIADMGSRVERAESRADELRERLDGAERELASALAAADQAHARTQAAEDAMTKLREAKDGEIASLRDMVVGLRDTVARAEHRAGHAERRAAEADARVQQTKALAEELRAGQAMMEDMHARDLAVAQHDAQAGQQAAAELRRADTERQARGRWARLRAAWRGE